MEAKDKKTTAAKTAAKSEESTPETAQSVAKKKSSAKPKRQPVMRKLTRGRAYIKSTYNNTIVTITDLQGNVVAWQSAGILGFKGAKKSTPYAATQIVKSVVEKVKDTGLRNVDVFVRGIGGGRESAVRALYTYGIAVDSIKDMTPMPHNGCRPKKTRRV